MSTTPSQIVALFGAVDGELARLVTELGMRTLALPMHTLSTFAVGSRPVDVAVLDLRGTSHLPEDAADFRRRHPKVPIILVTQTLEPTMMLEAMRAGIAECITEPLSMPTIDAAFSRVLAQRLPEMNGQLFAFVGAKGGIGTTTAAVNVATALATKERTLFIDLHVTYGDAAVFLGAEPRFSVVDALENIQRLDDSVFRTLIVPTHAGVDLLASSTQNVVAVVDAPRVARLLEFVLRRYRYVVADCPRSDATVLDALTQAAKIVLVVNQDLAALRSASRMATALRQRYRADRVMVVVNRFDAASEIGRDDVERVVGAKARHVMPSDYRTSLEALNRGLPLVTQNQTKLASSFDHLAKDLGGLAPTARAESKSGFLGRLTGKPAKR